MYVCMCICMCVYGWTYVCVCLYVCVCVLVMLGKSVNYISRRVTPKVPIRVSYSYKDPIYVLVVKGHQRSKTETSSIRYLKIGGAHILFIKSNLFFTVEVKFHLRSRVCTNRRTPEHYLHVSRSIIFLLGSRCFI